MKMPKVHLTIKTAIIGVVLATAVSGYAYAALSDNTPTPDQNTAQGQLTPSNDAAPPKDSQVPVDNSAPTDNNSPSSSPGSPANTDLNPPSDKCYSGCTDPNAPTYDGQGNQYNANGQLNEPAAGKKMVSWVMHYVDVSPADKPNTVAQEYCDYTFDDGTTSSSLTGIYTENFTQPIADYNQNNLPKIHGVCQ